MTYNSIPYSCYCEITQGMDLSCTGIKVMALMKGHFKGQRSFTHEQVQYYCITERILFISCNKDNMEDNAYLICSYITQEHQNIHILNNLKNISVAVFQKTLLNASPTCCICVHIVCII